MFTRAFGFERNRFLLAILVLALLGFLLVLWATDWGAGVSPDSVSYIAGARGLIMGAGITYPDGGGTRHVITLWPPLLSAALALPGLAGIDPASSGRFLNALLFSVNIVLVGLIAFKATDGSAPASLIAAALFASAPDIVEINLWIWSEPLFIALTLLSFLIYLSFLESRRAAHLAAAALVTGLAFLTRFVGAAWIAAILSMILLEKRLGATRERVKRAVAFGLLSMIPMMLWMFRNLMTAGSTLDRQIGFRRLYFIHFVPALETAYDWILPGLEVPLIKSLAVMLYSGLVGLLFVLVLVGVFKDRSGTVAKGQLSAAKLLLAYLILYGAAVLIARVFVDPNFPFNDRILSPALVSLILLIVILGSMVLRGSRSSLYFPSRGVQGFTLIVGLAVAAQIFFAVGESLYLASRARMRGLGYQSRSWQESLLVQSIESLPADTPIFSNGDDGLYFATGRPVWRLPERQDRSGEGDRIPDWAVTMTSHMDDEQAYVVYFDAITWRNVVTPEDIGEIFDVRQILLVEEGVMAEIRLRD